MLILSRQCGEKIVLTKDDVVIATITITDVNNKQVRVGIDADADICIDREEIFFSKAGFEVPQGEKR